MKRTTITLVIVTQLALLTAFDACGGEPVQMEALLHGKLVVDDGCLRVESSAEDSRLLVFQGNYSAVIDEEGTAIQDKEGRTVAHVGDYVSVGGGESSTGLAGDGTVQGTPGGCEGPFWLVSEIRPDPEGAEKAYASIDPATLFFPVQKEPQTIVLNSKLSPGRLVTDGRYLRVHGYLIIWPYGYSLDSIDNRIWVIDDEGEPVARVGDEVQGGGGELPAVFVQQKIGQELPINIEGPFWELGNISSD